MTTAGDYLRDPEAIYSLSFDRVRAATRLDRFGEDVAAMVIRVVHACGMPDLVEVIEASDDVAAKAAEALAGGAPVICDCAMVAAGITRRFLPASNDVLVTLNNAAVPERARRGRIARPDRARHIDQRAARSASAFASRQ